jgi:VanZ family protein
MTPDPLPRQTLWVPPLCWAALIFILSSLSGPDEPPAFWFEGLDKIIHAGIYAVLALLLLAALHFERRIALPWASVLAWILAVLYGATDEWHQRFTVGRSTEFADLLADAAGACAALATAWMLHRKQGFTQWIENRLKQK